MKKSLYICGIIVLASTGMARAALDFGGDWTANTVIPDGNPVGIAVSQTFSSYAGYTLTSVDVALNISGGFNGDLYGSLVYQPANGNAATEILLNRVGTTTGNPFGSAGSGFNVTLSDTGTANGSIHNAPGNPMGTWLPDSSSSLNGTFGGLAANGTWTLFLADMSVGGGTETLNSWGLDIEAVPEPAEYSLVAGALLMVASVWRRRR